MSAQLPLPQVARPDLERCYRAPRRDIARVSPGQRVTSSHDTKIPPPSHPTCPHYCPPFFSAYLQRCRQAPSRDIAWWATIPLLMSRHDTKAATLGRVLPAYQSPFVVTIAHLERQHQAPQAQTKLRSGGPRSAGNYTPQDEDNAPGARFALHISVPKLPVPTSSDVIRRPGETSLKQPLAS